MGLFKKMRDRFGKKQTGIERPKTKKLRSPGGGAVIATTDESPGMMPEPTDDLRVEPTSDEMVAYECGHRGAKTFTLNAFGDKFPAPDTMLAERKRCPDCETADVRAVIIRCAVCGHGIFPGEPVALYSDDARFNEKWKTKIDQGVIGCMRMNCCPSGGFFAGHWSGKEFVPAFGDTRSVAEEVFRTGQTILVSDGKVTRLPKK